MTLKTNQDNVVKYVVADLVPFQTSIEKRISLKVYDTDKSTSLIFLLVTKFKTIHITTISIT
jgi:hypothetical protein